MAINPYSEPGRGIGGQFDTSRFLLNTTLAGFEHSSALATVANTDYNEMFNGLHGMPSGPTISVRVPGYQSVQKGQTFTSQVIENQFQTIIVDYDDMRGDLFSYNVVEAEIDRNSVTDTVGYNFGIVLSDELESQLIDECNLNIPTFIDGTASTDFNYALLSDGYALANKLGIPRGRTGVLNTDDMNALLKGINSSQLFDQPLNAKVNRDRYIGTYAKTDLLDSEQMATKYHISSYPAGGALTVKSVTPDLGSIENAVLSLSGATPGVTLKKGDRLTFPNTQITNYINHRPVNHPYQCVVQEDVAEVGGDYDDVKVVGGIIPPIMIPAAGNPYQTVDGTPNIADPVTVAPSYKINFVFTKPGLTCAFIRMPDTSTIKDVLGNSFYEDRTKAGVYMRSVRDFTIDSNTIKLRIDMQPAFKCFQRYNYAILTKLEA